MTNNILLTHTDKSRAVIQGIDHCFSGHVDKQSINIVCDILKSMNVPNSDINTIMLLFAAMCAKHYKYGYMAAHNGTPRNVP